MMATVTVLLDLPAMSTSAGDGQFGLVLVGHGGTREGIWGGIAVRLEEEWD